MSLADRIQSDVDRIFYRQSEFAREHDWNGTLINCIVDDVDALAHKNANTLSVDFDIGEIDKIVRIPYSQLELIGELFTMQFVYLDEMQCRIERIADNEGEKIVLLRDQEARGIA